MRIYQKIQHQSLLTTFPFEVNTRKGANIILLIKFNCQNERYFSYYGTLKKQF